MKIPLRLRLAIWRLNLDATLCLVGALIAAPFAIMGGREARIGFAYGLVGLMASFEARQRDLETKLHLLRGAP